MSEKTGNSNLEPNIRRVLLEHLDAAKQFAEEGNYQRVSIQANRAITEASLFQESPDLVLPGLVLRLAALEITKLLGLGETLEISQKNALISLLKDLDGAITSDQTNLGSAAWRIYQSFRDALSRASRDKIEGRAYTDNPEFVSASFDRYFDFLREWWPAQAELRGMPFEGIENELDRIVRAHGANMRQLASLGLVRVLGWWAQYVSYPLRDKENITDPEKFREALEPVVGEIISIYRSKNEAEFFERASKILGKLLRDWRMDFVKYYDLFLIQQQQPVAPIMGIRRVPAAAKLRRGKRQRPQGEEEE